MLKLTRQRRRDDGVTNFTAGSCSPARKLARVQLGQGTQSRRSLCLGTRDWPRACKGFP